MTPVLALTYDERPAGCNVQVRVPVCVATEVTVGVMTKEDVVVRPFWVAMSLKAGEAHCAAVSVKVVEPLMVSTDVVAMTCTVEVPKTLFWATEMTPVPALMLTPAGAPDARDHVRVPTWVALAVLVAVVTP